MFWKKSKDKSGSKPALADIFNSIEPKFSDLSGQTAVVTGAGRGIGKGIALRLGREGMKIVINDVDSALAEKTANEFNYLGINVLAVQSDVGKLEGVERLFSETVKVFGQVNLLVNNAALLDRADLLETDLAMVEKQMETNIKGPYMCTLRAASLMKPKLNGSIINISSVGGARAHWQGTSYDMTKGAIDALTRASALDLARYGIRVNAVAPGAVRTERTEDSDPNQIEEISKRIPLARFGSPYEIGALVAFLASSEAQYITGQVIYIDGGISAQLYPQDSPI